MKHSIWLPRLSSYFGLEQWVGSPVKDGEDTLSTATWRLDIKLLLYQSEGDFPHGIWPSCWNKTLPACFAISVLKTVTTDRLGPSVTITCHRAVQRDTCRSERRFSSGGGFLTKWGLLCLAVLGNPAVPSYFNWNCKRKASFIIVGLGTTAATLTCALHGNHRECLQCLLY